MAVRFNVGDTAYMIESNRFIREVKIVKSGGGFYTVHFADSDSGTRVRESRLFKTRDDAEASLPKDGNSKKKTRWDLE